MKKLVSSREAAQLLGLSLQGIHYRIKKGQLESIKQDGKIFVYVDNSQTNNKQVYPNTNNPVNDYKKLEEKIIHSKDEQIHLLKKTIKFMKKQYTSEIERLDKNQTQVLRVFQSEVDLLKSAFNEMRNIYKIDHEETRTRVQNQSDESPKNLQMEFMAIKDFFIVMKNYNKTDTQIKSIILNKVKQGDKRFIYNKVTKEVLIYKDDFLDLI